ncbi:response regulator transcription factor [Ectobacillus sp. sgz5001026]|uniref:response regulator transcription factor n=1 Tax=Ectobacillus sp. sgz5001026 TaxID=3242473 RepID=UPI0036D2F92B
MKPTVLLVDDDENIRMIEELYLKKEGFQTVMACDGEEALRVLDREKIDCAVIDIMMPRMDGWQLCKEIKAYYEIPVLMVTALNQAEDTIKGFQIGTDDYMAKPFHPMELVMRVKAILKRYHISDEGSLSLKDILIDSNRYEVRLGDEAVTLPIKQFELLYTLAAHPGKIFTRDELIEKIWGFDYEGDDRTVDTHITRLRKHLKEFEHLLQIVTVRGLGYKVELV